MPASLTGSDLLNFCNSSLEKEGYGIFLSNFSALLPPKEAADVVKPSAIEVWGLGLLFVTIISSCAAIGIGLMPLLSKRLYYIVLTYFVGLGVGSLSGSAVFHLLPQTFELIVGDDHSYLLKSWVVILGIYMFFFTDKFLQLLVKLRKQKKASGSDSARPMELTNGGCTIPSTENSTAHLVVEKNGGVADKYVTRINLKEGNSSGEEDDVVKDIEHQVQAMCNHHENVEYKEGDSVIATVAWMVIFGDGLHNFIDGLSIGAAFSTSILSGVSVSVAVICEEFPHELGDVAILINAGMTLRQALMYNLLSAMTCYLGFVIGVLLGEMAEASVYIFGLAGGMFLYISLASMIPEMNATVEKEMEVGIKKGLTTLFLQSAGVMTGLVIMFLMSYYASAISFE